MDQWEVAMLVSGASGPVIRQAMEDPEFRERLLADPSSAIEEVTGVRVPADLEIVVMENTAKRWHLVLPPVEVDIAAMDPSAGNLLTFDPEYHQLRPPRADWLLS